MGDENPIHTLGDYSRPSHEGYRNTIELPKGNNVQHHGESLSEAWNCFKDLLRKVPHHGIDLWLQVKIFYDRIDHTLNQTVDYVVGGRLSKISTEKAWATIEELARYEDEGWNDPVIIREGSLDYENPNIEQLLGVMECKVDTLIKEAISLMGRDESVFGMTSNTRYPLPSEPSRQKEFEDLVMNFILDEKKGLTNSKITCKILQMNSWISPLREVLSFDGSEPQPLLINPSSDINLREERGLEPPIRAPSPDSFRMNKVIFDEKKLRSSSEASSDDS
nr:zinc finger, CCHC-type [Tanacetum cinerariifolium]